MNNKKLWYPAAMVIALSVAFGTAQAKSLEQVGASEGHSELLKTYGVDVSAKAGLKTLLPAGWNLFIYKNTSLPQTISWMVGDTWIGALEHFADRNELAVRVDWLKKAVYVSSPEVALEARARVSAADNIARTPLPAYTPAAPVASATIPTATATPNAALTPQPQARVAPETQVAKASAPAAESRVSSELLARALAATAPASSATPVVQQTPILVSANASSAPLAAKPVQALPVLAAVAAPAQAPLAAQPVAPQSALPAVVPYYAPLATPALVTVAAPVPASDAFVRGNMEDMVRKTASKLGYKVSWETVSLPVTGPVTFLGVDAAEDMRLLQQSLGSRQSPIAIEVYRGSSVIRVTASAQGREPLAVYSTTYSGLVGFGPKGAATLEPLQSGVVESIMQARPSTVTSATAVFAPHVSTAELATATTPPMPQAVPATPTFSLSIAKGDSLSKAITQFLKAQGWEMKWQVPTDLEADYPFEATGPSIAYVLNALLPKLGLDTDMYTPSKMVVVRPIDNTAE